MKTRTTIFALLLFFAIDPCFAQKVTRLTDTGSRNGQGFWSPDGTRIAFVSNQCGSWQIWMIDPDGANAKQVTDDKSVVHAWPNWYPDGDKLVFYSGKGQAFDIGLLDLKSGTIDRVVPSKHGVSNFRPVFSKDAKRLLFDRVGEGVPGSHDIFTFDTETSELRRLTSNPAYESDARWSPDGNRIVFHSDRNSKTRFHTQVHIMDSDGTNIRMLTHGDAKSLYPCWSPQGDKIVYVNDDNGNTDLWIMRPDGTSKRRITDWVGADSEPSWSPDGKKILFSTSRYGSNSIELALITFEKEFDEE